MMDHLTLLLDQLAADPPRDAAQLRRMKAAVAARTRLPLARTDALLARYRAEVGEGRRPAEPRLERLLTLNRIRSESGIATITVLTKPYACPGRCVYCPTEARAPKSYLANEPAMMRAIRNGYDPYRQVAVRLDTLAQTGHPTDKLELIIKGGTWSFYPDPYQRWFIQRCLEAANTFAQGSRLKAQGTPTRQPGASSLEPPAFSLEPRALLEAQQRNEISAHRIIGVTIETRPDYIDLDEVRRLRELGVTRVELGVQTLEEAVLARVVRDHGAAEVRQATALLKNAGFKVAYHLMPNLPGATPESDLAHARLVFEDPAYRPDAIKLYPCVVLESAELSRWWREGRYAPYDDEALIELLLAIKQAVPPYVRIERVIRDIPSTSITAGCRVTNLRQELARRLRERGLRCACIRCRQVRAETASAFALTRRAYEASGGTEVFLSFEEAEASRLACLLRLRLPAAGEPILPELRDAALVRELHAYGPHVPLAERRDGAAQHQGFGRRLLAEAERIAREEFGRPRIAVIAGVGVREYYRRLGYERTGTYMVKRLA